jgi:dienelactone hydrolase
LWYPAAAGGAPFTVGQFATSPSSFADEAGVDGLPADVISRYASRPLFASAGAAKAPGRFPLVVISQGNQQRPLHQAVLAEFLASHGFVVISATSTTVTSPMKTADDVGPAAQREAEQLQALTDFGKSLSQVDGSRVSVVAHSFGARAALLLTMHDAATQTLVSLDGGIGTAQSMESFRRAKWFAVDRGTTRILHYYETADQFMTPEFTLLRSLPSRSLTLRKVDGLHHVHFTTLGFAAALDPALADAVHLEPNAVAALRATFDELLGFLQGRSSK